MGSPVDSDMLSGAGVAGRAVLLLEQRSGLECDLMRSSCVENLSQHVASSLRDDAEECDSGR